MKLSIVSSLLLLVASSQKAAALVSSATTEHNHDDEMMSSTSTLMNKNNDNGGNSLNGPLAQTHEQKTVICPGTAQNLYEGHIRLGARTRFVLKNTASDPVVVAFVEGNGTEISAANEGIAPAHLDPDAHLAPGVTKVFAVQEGHVFHIRDSETGELLLQHRVGLMPIENKYQQNIPSCTATAGKLPAKDNNYRKMRKYPNWKPAVVERYSQEVSVDMGFTNKVQSMDGTTCPVNLYFVTKEKSHPTKKPNYWERFTFHLGANSLATAEDGELWDASTKYERTYIGHEFVARLAQDDTTVVDHFSVGPVKVQDCGRKKQRTAIKQAAHATAIVIPVGRSQSQYNGDGDETSAADSAPTNFNQTGLSSSSHAGVIVSSFNTTESRRGLYFKMYTE